MLSNPVRAGSGPVSKLDHYQDQRKVRGTDQNPESYMFKSGPVALLPHVGAVLRDNSPVFYQ